MIIQLKKHYTLFSIMLIGGFTIARILYAQSFLLTPDETNYWQWSRHLAWGYHDQTPMIAWASCKALTAYWITCTVSMPESSSKNHPQLVYMSMA